MIISKSQLHPESKGESDPTFCWEQWHISRRAHGMGEIVVARMPSAKEGKASMLSEGRLRVSDLGNRGHYFCTMM